MFASRSNGGGVWARHFGFIKVNTYYYGDPDFAFT